MQYKTGDREPRVPYAGSVYLDAGGRRLPCRVGNLSTTGMLVYPTCRGLPGQRVRMVFALPKQAVGVEVEIVREAEEQAQYAWGVRFAQIPDELTLGLRRYVNRFINLQLSRQEQDVPGSLGSTRRIGSGQIAASSRSAFGRARQHVRKTDPANPVLPATVRGTGPSPAPTSARRGGAAGSAGPAKRYDDAERQKEWHAGFRDVTPAPVDEDSAIRSDDDTTPLPVLYERALRELDVEGKKKKKKR